MVKASCVVCKSNSDSENKVGFFKFPHDKVLLKEWRELLNMTRKRLKSTSLVCSQHFQDSDCRLVRGKWTLNKEAVPNRSQKDSQARDGDDPSQSPESQISEPDVRVQENHKAVLEVARKEMETDTGVRKYSLRNRKKYESIIDHPSETESSEGSEHEPESDSDNKSESRLDTKSTDMQKSTDSKNSHNSQTDRLENSKKNIPAPISEEPSIIDSINPNRDKESNDNLSSVLDNNDSSKQIEEWCVPIVDSSIPTADSSIPPVDSRIPTVDSGIPPVDSRIQTVDSGIPPVDSRIQTVDSGIPPVDSRIPTVDSSIPTVDSSIPPVDSRIPNADSSIPPADSRVPTVDSSIPTVDSSMFLDEPVDYESLISQSNLINKNLVIKNHKPVLEAAKAFFYENLANQGPESPGDCEMLVENVQVDIDPSTLLMDDALSTGSCDDDVEIIPNKPSEPVSLLTSSDEDEVILQEPDIPMVELSSETDEEDMPLTKLCKDKTKQKAIKDILYKKSGELFCFTCGYSAIKRADFNAHMKGHVKPTRVRTIEVCHYCGYSTCSKDALFRHFRKHKHEKRFQCSLCDYKAKHKMSLIYHMKTHSESEKRMNCKKCNYGTSNKVNLRRHVRRMHSDSSGDEYKPADESG